MGYGVSSVTYAYYTWTDEENNNKQMKIATSIASAVIAGFAKESWDLYRGDGTADGWDWMYTITGGIIGAIMTDWIYNKVPNL